MSCRNWEKNYGSIVFLLMSFAYSVHEQLDFALQWLINVTSTTDWNGFRLSTCSNEPRGWSR